MNINSREEWLNIAAGIITTEIIEPVIDLPAPPARYSLTAPKTAQKKSVILGECWNRAASSDGYNEIFITANMGESDSLNILAVTIHEMMHAYDNNVNGHKAPFIKLCKLVGLEGGNNGRTKNSFTCTVPSLELIDKLNALIERIGPIPHAAMNVSLNGKPKQKNRQLLVKCKQCEFKFRASQKIIDSITINTCLSCGDSSLTIDTGE